MFLFMLLYAHIPVSDTLSFEPAFDMPVVNVTINEGETAILPCSVSYLGDYEVVWTDQWSTLLTYEDRRIIDDRRLSIERPFTKDWNLHIRNTKRNDQGTYNCQVNTTPVKIKTVMLTVDVPAKILQEYSSEDMTVKEGETVTLQCNVSGIPMPNVTWTRYTIHRDDAQKKTDLCPGTYNIGEHREILMIQNASRECWGIYKCTAFNGVPPADNREIGVIVEFPPEVVLPNNKIGQYQEKETILECVVTANPHAVSVWTRHGYKINNSVKYRTDIYRDGEYTITLSLRIRTLEADDFGIYVCEASNVQGTSQQLMTLYDYAEYRSKVDDEHSTTTTLASVKTDWISIQTRYPITRNRTGSILVMESGRHTSNNNGPRNGVVLETGNFVGSGGNRLTQFFFVICIAAFHV
ncbi:lachesin-like [Haliotis cracherodii]|uniref:lachesin-like n=1 Tax=Haliotis cracherodii TaxID=6455 RepID=UPI0039EA504A